MSTIMTSILCQMTTTSMDIGKVLDNFVGEINLKQYEMAGVELGRLMELSKQLNGLSFIARQALWDSSK